MNVHPLRFFGRPESKKGAEHIEIETANRRIGSVYPFAIPSGNDPYLRLPTAGIDVKRTFLRPPVQPSKASSRDDRLPDLRAIVAATTLQFRAISSLLASSERLSAME